MSKKTFTCTRIELGQIEADTKEKGWDEMQDEGFNVGHSTEHISEENDLFWGNLTCDMIDDMRKGIINFLETYHNGLDVSDDIKNLEQIFDL